MAAPVSHFVNLWETETDREQPVLFAHRPGTRKAKALAQPQHRLETLDRAPAVGKVWKPPTRGMGLFTWKWSLSIPCCRCLVT